MFENDYRFSGEYNDWMKQYISGRLDPLIFVHNRRLVTALVRRVMGRTD